MPQGTCNISECEDPLYCKGMCKKHYARWRKHGDVNRVDKSGMKAGPVKICSIEGCEGKVNSHGLCGKHDARRHRLGDPLAPVKEFVADIEQRFLAYIAKSDNPDSCWIWTASTFPDGYGLFWEPVAKTNAGAHRWSYAHFVGPVPEGLQLDHLCHTRERETCPGGKKCPHRRCVNPAHLEPVTQLVNARRAVPHAGMKVSPEMVAAFYARWQAGERVTVMAAEAGVKVGALYKRFYRLEDRRREEASA